MQPNGVPFSRERRAHAIAPGLARPVACRLHGLLGRDKFEVEVARDDEV